MSKMSDTALDALITLEQDTREYGFDWPNQEMIIDQAISECEEIREAILHKEPPHRIREEIGDLLHTAISLCIFSGYDVKDTLANVNEKFEARMSALKKIANERGLEDLKGQPIEFMLELWREAKKQSKR
ncbi:MazG nucleotide pyrophosphohydrolase domain-containing protein [Candidatus Jidaibacter acanthamoebae]|nr:MazG nucleotide pyrophosphohydrolase domain-containing protein [Candidatus Jidaibacter acanthamoeba]